MPLVLLLTFIRAKLMFHFSNILFFEINTICYTLNAMNAITYRNNGGTYAFLISGELIMLFLGL